MNKTLSITKSDSDFLDRSMSFIRESLERLKISRKNALKTELLAEEILVTMSENADPTAVLTIKISRFAGDARIDLSMEGEEFDPDAIITDTSDTPVDRESEQAIRAIFIKAFGENLKYNNRRGVNHVRILAGEGDRAMLLRTFIAIAAGLLLGFIMKYLLAPSVSEPLANYLLTPFKTIFMRCLTMVVAPVIFFSIVTSMSQFKNISQIGKLAGKVFGIYVFTSIVAVLIAFIISCIICPGEPGFALSILSFENTSDISTATVQNISVVDEIVDIFPSNFIRPFFESNTLQLIFLAALCGIAINMVGEYTNTLKSLFEALNSLALTVTSLITGFLPIMVFCSMALMIYQFSGEGSLLPVIQNLFVALLAIICMMMFYGILLLLVGKVNPLKFYSKLKESWITAISTCSSSASIPTNLRVSKENLGVSGSICNFSIPLGATVNMDGTCISTIIIITFLARACSVTIPASAYPTIALTMLMLSMAAPGIPGYNVIMVSTFLELLGIPIESISLVLAMLPFYDMLATTNNITGDLAVTTMVAGSEGLLDRKKFNGK